jgi:hypothetical protein
MKLQKFHKIPLCRIAEITSDLHKRKGVQILYRKSPKFLQFLRETFVQEVDDNSLSLATRFIPQELIFGFVLLGEYEIAEKEKLLSKT